MEQSPGLLFFFCPHRFLAVIINKLNLYKYNISIHFFYCSVRNSSLLRLVLSIKKGRSAFASALLQFIPLFFRPQLTTAGQCIGFSRQLAGFLRVIVQRMSIALDIGKIPLPILQAVHMGIRRHGPGSPGCQ